MEQQNAYRSLQIKGTNSSALAIVYMIFAVYEKNFQLDVISGNINKIDEIKFNINLFLKLKSNVSL
jgi:hypothetical protein